MSDGSLTAQDAFRDMMRHEIAPAIRRMGFAGSGGNFRLVDGDDVAHVESQKSRWNSKDEVAFTFNLWVSGGRLSTRLGELLPERRDFWWVLGPETSVDELAGAVIRALEDFGWPAIQAALEAPEPSPAITPAEPPLEIPEGGAEYTRRLLALVEQTRAASIDELFELLSSVDQLARSLALDAIGKRAIDDPRALPAISDRISNDPGSHIRRTGCMVLAHVRGHGHHRELETPLTALATEDDDPEVRWAARFALLVRRRSAERPAVPPNS